jgi:hypothetical protein
MGIQSEITGISLAQQTLVSLIWFWTSIDGAMWAPASRSNTPGS